MTDKATGGLKLNVGRTIMVGLAFFTVTMFWQVYDSLMPLFLLDFGFSYAARGIVMALDNVLALVLLPFMGLLSDRFPNKLRHKFGRRIPFIVCGSVLAAAMFLLVNFAHNQRMLALMLVTTAFVLVFMCMYRTPAVALMPDVTPKQIRSQANTVINIMGTVGGFITLVLMTFLVKKTDGLDTDGTAIKILTGNNWVLIALIAALMIAAAVIMVFKVKENKLVEEKKAYLESLGLSEDDDLDDEDKPKEKGATRKMLKSLSRAQIVSLFLLLASVFLWYMAYNAVTSHFSAFAWNVLNLDSFTVPLMIAQIAAFIMFVPASLIGKKIGRKSTVLIGIICMFAGLAMSSVLIFTASEKVVQIAMYPAFVLVGAGWATINVHSYVMSVEMASKHNTGVFTGLYYTFAMGAQAITPFLAGLVMDHIDARGLLVYSAVFVALAFVTMAFVRHGNASDKPISGSGLFAVGDTAKTEIADTDHSEADREDIAEKSNAAE